MRERHRSPQATVCRRRPTSETPQPGQTRPAGRRTMALRWASHQTRGWPRPGRASSSTPHPRHWRRGVSSARSCAVPIRATASRSSITTIIPSGDRVSASIRRKSGKLCSAHTGPRGRHPIAPCFGPTPPVARSSPPLAQRLARVAARAEDAGPCRQRLATEDERHGMSAASSPGRTGCTGQGQRSCHCRRVEAASGSRTQAPQPAHAEWPARRARASAPRARDGGRRVPASTQASKRLLVMCASTVLGAR